MTDFANNSKAVVRTTNLCSSFGIIITPVKRHSRPETGVEVAHEGIIHKVIDLAGK